MNLVLISPSKEGFDNCSVKDSGIDWTFFINKILKMFIRMNPFEDNKNQINL